MIQLTIAIHGAGKPSALRVVVYADDLHIVPLMHSQIIFSPLPVFSDTGYM